MKYNHQKIEKKWQKVWAKGGFKLWKAGDKSANPKKYVLDMFPYPSGEGLHVGHLLGYVGSDILSRYYRMRGFNVLHPMGWDAFGLPAENYAIKHKIHPAVAVKKNIKNFKCQLNAPGFSYDWSREINTTDPEYYKWTQWIFLQLFKKGLAYEADIPVNWCSKDKTVLANEEVVDGACERCHTKVERKKLKQWVLKITAYADRLLDDLKLLDWPEKVKDLQRNWIGRSEGALISFNVKCQMSNVKCSPAAIEVFTTRPDTLAGATYLVLAPEHELVAELLVKKNNVIAIRQQAEKQSYSIIKNREEIEKYIDYAKNKSDLERQGNKQKTGVELKGIKAVNPWNNQEISIWVSDYVLGNYGTGAIMAVPAHDDRDREFAVKFNLPIVDEPLLDKDGVIVKVGGKKTVNYKLRDWIFSRQRYWGEPIPMVKCLECGAREFQTKWEIKFYHEKIWENILNEAKTIETRALNPEEPHRFLGDIKAGDIVRFVYPKAQFARLVRVTKTYTWKNLEELFQDKNSLKAIYAGKPPATLDKLVASYAELATGYADKIQKNGLVGWEFTEEKKYQTVPVPEKDLPVKLPKVKSYEPTGTGESPLAAIDKWVNTKCPVCGGPAKRETNTMPQWAGSCWYYIAYACKSQIAKRGRLAISDWRLGNYWLPVDLYIGGVEHAVLHLLYARFWHKVLYDIGAVSAKEPFQKLMNQGLMMGPDGQKMSKSRGNVISPDEMIKTFGADAMRAYEMFMGPFEDSKAWDPHGIVGVRRFLERIWNFVLKNAKTKVSDEKALRALHRAIKKVTEDVENFRFNTAISALMIFINEAENLPLSKNDCVSLLKIISPFTPHIAQELATQLGYKKLFDVDEWPAFDASLLREENFDLIIQINGKIRGKIIAQMNTSEASAKDLAMREPNIIKWLAGKPVKKVIYVKNRLINLIV